MPLTHRVDAGRRRVEVTASGTITYDDLRTYFRERAVDPAFSSAFDALIDFRGVTGFLSAEELRRFADEVSGWLGRMPSRRAVVVASDVLYGMGRMLEAHTLDAPVEYRMFRDVPSAERWLADPSQR